MYKNFDMSDISSAVLLAFVFFDKLRLIYLKYIRLFLYHNITISKEWLCEGHAVVCV